MIGEGSTHQRSSDGGYAVHGAYESRVDGPFDQRNRVRDDDERPGEDACGSQTGNGTANDESYRCWRSTTDYRADLEDKDSHQINPFDREEGVKFAEEQLEGACSQKICGAIPPYILESLEMIRYFWDRRRNDGVILHDDTGSARSSIRFTTFQNDPREY